MSFAGVFTYGLVSGIVLMTLRANRRARRPDGRMLALAGWGMMAMSFAVAAMLIGVVAIRLLG